jgi:hypothetical protein
LNSLPTPSPSPSSSPSITPSPSPTVPEQSWLTILPLLLFVFSVAVILMYRKTLSQNKPNV